MKIIIHQAICGEKNKSWDLLKTTLQDYDLGKNIALKTDIQDTAGGQKWSPTIRGFAYGEYFLVMRSFLDPGDVRPGRAFSHVLILSTRDILRITDLKNLFNFIPNEIYKNIDLQPLIIDSSCLQAEIDSTSYTTSFKYRFGKLVSGYVNLSEYKNTFLWIGYEDYELAVCELWKRLTTEERLNFEFGLYFNATAIPKNKLNLITIAPRNASKFSNSGFLLIDINDKIELTGIAERLLMGDETLTRSVKEFADAIGVKKFERSDWSTMSIGLKTFENFHYELNFKKLKTFAHIVSKFSPSAKSGASFKIKIAERLGKVLETASAEEVMIFKSIVTKSFTTARSTWKKSFNIWLTKNLFTLGNASVKSVEILLHLNNSNAKGWWHETLKNKVNDFFSSNGFEASIVYEWIEFNPNIFNSIKQYFQKENEAQFAEKALEKLKENTIQQLKTYARDNNWFFLHAKILLLELSVSDALTEQMKIDKDVSSMTGIMEILKESTSKEVVHLALLNKDPRLTNLASAHCKNDPTILNSIDITSVYAQEIWLKAIELGNELDTGFVRFKEVTYKLFDVLVSGGSVLPNIIERIGNSKYANIRSYKSRVKLWDRLPMSSRVLFLKSTSEVLLEELSNGKAVTLPEDAVLSNYIFENAISEFFYFNRTNIKSIIPILKKYKNIPNDYLDTYLRNFSGSLDGIEAKSLGKLITERSAAFSAHIIFNRSEKNNSWSIALKECYTLLPFKDKAKMFFMKLIPKVKISTDQWWEKAHEIISNYYSNPASLVRIWTRAGGHESDLVLSVSAKDTWSNALERIKKGQLKTVTMNALLKEINKEYGDVDGFRLLFHLRKNHIKTK